MLPHLVSDYLKFMSQILRESVSTLAVILVTGVIDLQARLINDQDWTLGLVERDYNFIAEQCAYFGGQVIKATEGGVIATFKTPEEAVQCTLDTQKTLTRAAASMQARDVLNHAMGIHYGELIINGSEISGSGVVIANRLQLGANWGTVHISEAIYQAIRGTPHDQAVNYVGERFLLRIYQLLPKGFSSPMPQLHPQNFVDLDDTTIPEPTLADASGREQFDQVIDKLNHHYQVLEIKQLILFLCLQKWETDRLKLQKINLKGLVQELLEITGSLFELNSLVNGAIANLDHKYSAVSIVIVRIISCLYPDYQPNPANIYEELAQSLLDPDKDVVRVQKLIFHVCHYDLPEQNLVKLDAAIRALQQLYPSLEGLRNRLKLAIANKPEYNGVADIVVDELSAIYPKRVYAATKLESLPTVEVSTTAAAKPVKSEAESKSLPKSFDQQIADLNLFDLRLEIIKYLSPLRVKILIFSALNEVADNTSDSISAIRTFELDDLLRDLFYAHRDLHNLEVSLTDTAKQFKDVDEYLQAAAVIVKAIAPIYGVLNNSNF